MEFTETSKNEWTCGDYRITYNEPIKGETTGTYHACVRSVRRHDGVIWWDFVKRRRAYRGFNVAVQDCEKHERAWHRMLKLNEATGNRMKRVAELKAKNVLIYSGLPVWVHEQLDPAIAKMLK